MERIKTTKSIIRWTEGILTVLLSIPASAAVYFVDIATGSDANTGLNNTGQQWAHCPGAQSNTVYFAGTGWQQLLNGDTLVVKGGSVNKYSVMTHDANYHGAASYNSITIISGDRYGTPWGSGPAVFDGTPLNTNLFLWGFADPNSAATIQGITLDGFVIANLAGGDPGTPWTSGTGTSTGSGGIQMGGGNNPGQFITVQHCILTNFSRISDDTGHGIEGHNSTEILICSNNIGPNIGTKGTEIVQVGTLWRVHHNQYIQSQDHNVIVSGNNCDVYNNFIIVKGPYAHAPIYGIKMNGSFNDAWNNVILMDQGDLQTGPCGMGYDTFSTPLGNSSIGGMSNRYVYNTIWGFTAGCSPPTYGNAGVGISFNFTSTPGTTNCLAQNNLILQCANCRSPAEGIGLFFLNTTVGGNFAYNDLWNATYGGLSVDVQYGGSAAPPSYTMAAFQAAYSGAVNNHETDPVITGGTLPSGLNASYQPNTTYFLLTAQSPQSVTTTGNNIQGDSAHGYNHNANKFTLDIVGSSRVNYSAGAYEYSGVIPPPGGAPITVGSGVSFGNGVKIQ